MRRITYWILSTVTVLVLLFSYHTSRSSQLPAEAVAPYVASGTTSTSGRSSSGNSSSSTPSASSSSPGSSSRASTVTGDVVQTQWGPVQVQLRMTGSKITKVAVLQYPNGNPRDAEINAQALPILVQETQDAQSAQIDMVSGATVTSDGYLQSLQSALDKVQA